MTCSQGEVPVGKHLDIWEQQNDSAPITGFWQPPPLLWWQNNVLSFPKVYHSGFEDCHQFPKYPGLLRQFSLTPSMLTILSSVSSQLEAVFDQVMTHWTVHSNFPVRKIMRKGNTYRGRRIEVVFGLLPENEAIFILYHRPRFDASWGRQTISLFMKPCFFFLPIRIKEEDIFEFHVFR